MMKLNRKMYLDRVSACWIGKNIGGTMGAPYEGDPNMQDISGFATPPGEPMPNDDLDLQIIWLTAVEDRGIYSITPRVLGEYWLNYVVPYCNEYGNAKANMKLGLLPPYSGEYLNEQWKNSNGAWIRTEIWACLFPGFPQYAVKYAYMDACVDHGLGEGTYAAMFTAALENDDYFAWARHANAMADIVRAGMERGGVAQFIKTTTNQVFPVITREQEAMLAEKIEFEHWGDVDEDHVAIRFVTSWATAEEDARALAAIMEAL